MSYEIAVLLGAAVGAGLSWTFFGLLVFLEFRRRDIVRKAYLRKINDPRY